MQNVFSMSHFSVPKEVYDGGNDNNPECVSICIFHAPLFSLFLYPASAVRSVPDLSFSSKSSFSNNMILVSCCCSNSASCCRAITSRDWSTTGTALSTYHQTLALALAVGIRNRVNLVPRPWFIRGRVPFECMRAKGHGYRGH